MFSVGRLRLKGNLRRRGSKAIVVSIVCFLLCIYLLPFFWIVLSSFKPANLIISYPPVMFFHPTLEHFFSLHSRWNFYHKISNSLIIAGGTVTICVFLGMIAAYALSRYRIKGRDFLLIWILSFRFLPVVAILLPLFLLFKSLKLVDSYVGLMIANVVPNLPFSTWLLHGFFAEIPREIDDAAKIDGCGDMAILWRILFPMAAPAVAVTAIFIFLFSWNEFFIPLALSGTQTATVSLAFSGFRQHLWFDWGAMSAASLICLVPLWLVIQALQKHIIRGITLGAVKG